MQVLVLNSGSSSLKFRLCEIRDDDHTPVHTVLGGLIESIGGAAVLRLTSTNAPVVRHERQITDHAHAVAWLFDWLRSREASAAGAGLLSQIDAIGHRVVHGGARFQQAVQIDTDVLAEIERLCELAPLHNPASLAVIRKAQALFGSAMPMVAVFDTAFHHTLPARAALYALPPTVAAAYHIRRYGFHGIAHASLADGYARATGQQVTETRLITLHLGNGCSATALQYGQSVDTSMGFTPLEGLMMGTRAGDLDPAIVSYLARHVSMSLDAVERMLNSESGLLGVSGLSQDMRTLQAALANKGGINLIHTYEAFGTKMHGAIRQEIIFARHCAEAGRPPGWLSVPLVLTSHTWENGKNEQSHQDPSMAEALLGEPCHISRVVFPADFNTAAATIERVYQTQGQIWTIVVPKAETLPDLFTATEARRLVTEGALQLEWAGYAHEQAQVILVAVGAYQLSEVLTASSRLAERQIPHRVVYLFEPGRFRTPRSDAERRHQAPAAVRETLFPANVSLRVFVTHTRPEVILGVVGPLHTGARTCGLGFINEGGTLNTPGMLFVNRCSWAHCLADVARLLEVPCMQVLSTREEQALSRQASPHGIIIPEVTA